MAEGMDATLTIGNIRADWDKVRPALEELCANYRQSWRPEDVYAEVVSGECLYLCTPKLFVVVKTYNEPYTGEKVFFIWLVYAYEKGEDLVGVHLHTINQMAKELNCSRIETATPAHALVDHLEKHGFDKDTVVLTRRIYE